MNLPANITKRLADITSLCSSSKQYAAGTNGLLQMTHQDLVQSFDLVGMGVQALAISVEYAVRPGNHDMLNALTQIQPRAEIKAVRPTVTALPNVGKVCGMLGSYVASFPSLKAFATETQLVDTIKFNIGTVKTATGDWERIQTFVLNLESTCVLFNRGRQSIIPSNMEEPVRFRKEFMTSAREALLSAKAMKEPVFCVRMVQRIQMLEEVMEPLEAKMDKWVKGCSGKKDE